MEVCNEPTDLDVRVHVHQSPLAVVTADAERQLHLFVQQDAYFNSLFLQTESKQQCWEESSHYGGEIISTLSEHKEYILLFV